MDDGEVGAARYRAFISYCHRDDKVARWLHGAIEAYRVPKALVGHQGEFGPVPRRLGPVFRDEEELAGAAELGPKLEEALRASAALIVICSTQAAKSLWVDREIRLFNTIHPARAVLAVIANGVPDSDRECFPPSLKFALSPDGDLVEDAGAEPLAPDLQKHDRDSVKLKLIAGLLGVGYNDLARRDLRRARRNMALLGTLATSVIAALAVLAVTAISYAKVAVHQRHLAEKAQAAAERNAEEAERRAWLAQTAAEEIRRQADLLSKAPKQKDCAPPH